MSPIGFLTGFIVFGFGGAIIYLYLFNRRTRQSLHDLVVGTFVTRLAPPGKAVVGSIWRPHLIVVGVWLVAMVGVVGALAGLSRQGVFPGLLKVQRSIQATGKVHTSGVSVGKQWSTFGGNLKETRYLRTKAFWKEPPDNPGAGAQEVASIVLRDYPEARDMDDIEVTISYGFDIGLGSAWKNLSFHRSPSEWVAMLAQPPPK